MIKKIDHIAIAVKNLEEGARIWKSMGLKVEYEVVEEQKVRVGMIKIGDSRIEILEPTSEDSSVSKFINKRGEGLHHIAVEVDNIQKCMRYLKEEGYELIDDKPRNGANGKKIAFVHPKTAKVLLELVEG